MKVSQSVDLIEQNINKLPEELQDAARTLIGAVKKCRSIFANKTLAAYQAGEMYDRVFEEVNDSKEE